MVLDLSNFVDFIREVRLGFVFWKNSLLWEYSFLSTDKIKTILFAVKWQTKSLSLALLLSYMRMIKPCSWLRLNFFYLQQLYFCIPYQFDNGLVNSFSWFIWLFDLTFYVPFFYYFFNAIKGTSFIRNFNAVTKFTIFLSVFAEKFLVI